MTRKEIDKLIHWKDSDIKKPALLTGAKGVGKTFLAYDFAKAFFRGIIYINLERERACKDFFRPDDIDNTCSLLMKHCNLDDTIQPEDIILILDEVTYCTEALYMLSALQNSGKFPFIIIISSEPLYEYTDTYRIPVYPIEFDDFLRATANEWYIEAIITHYATNKQIPEIVHNELLILYELYMRIGGMPQLINEYLSFGSCVNLEELHNLLISSYQHNIIHKYKDSDALKMNQVLDSIPAQLMKENKKFQYKLIRKGTTHPMYKEAIKSLADRDYVLQCLKLSSEELRALLIHNTNSNNNSHSSNNSHSNRTTNSNSNNTSTISNSISNSISSSISNDISNSISNSNTIITTLNDNQYTHPNSFKLYMPDIGMLHSKLIEEELTPFNEINRKALLENYVAQTLHTNNYKLMFWESSSMAKVEFIIEKDNSLIPIEIHTTDNTRSKSISVLKQVYEFPYAIKLSTKNFDFSNGIKYVPYYAAFCI